MAYQFTFEPIAANWPLLVQGASLTLALTAISATVGLADSTCKCNTLKVE